MRCRNARVWLEAQLDGELDAATAAALQEHLKQCECCREFERHQRSLHAMLCVPVPRVRGHLSTEHIMQAVQQQRQISQQLEDIRRQQKTRIERWRTVGAISAALCFFTLSSIPLLVLAITLIQTDLVVQSLSLLNGIIDTFILLAQYMQTGLILVTRDNWLLSGVAFAVVVMMGMWLRLMRPPQEA